MTYLGMRVRPLHRLPSRWMIFLEEATQGLPPNRRWTMYLVGRSLRAMLRTYLGRQRRWLRLLLSLRKRKEWRR